MSDLLVGIFHLLEQNLAQILIDNIVNRDLTEKDKEDNKIPIKDVYFQMINNNVVDIETFNAADSSENEKNIFNKMNNRKTEIISEIKTELYNTASKPLNKLTDEKKAYYNFVFNMLSDSAYGLNIISKSNLTSDDTVYKSWRNDELSLREILLHCVASNYINVAKLDIELNYADRESVYNA